jgi:hypothetical protein
MGKISSKQNKRNHNFILMLLTIPLGNYKRVNYVYAMYGFTSSLSYVMRGGVYRCMF